MKDRLPALDGLRGLAAFSVLLSHAGYSPATLISAPLIIAIYNTLQVGPNSVQILFVLSGFLMAFLYPRVKSARSFIQKRYARIFPIYVTIVVFLWIINLEQFVKVWWMQLITLLILAGFVYLLWRVMKKIPQIGKILFFFFLGLQLIGLIIALFIVPRFVYADNLILPTHIKNLIILLCNLTLTTPFGRDIPRMSVVFWSLAPEIYFYLLYPFLVVPLIQLGKRYGYLVSIVVIICVTKILFDLDRELTSLGGLQSINIARSSGFVAGVTVGTIYQTKGKFWTKIEPIVKNPFYSITVLLLLVFIQWGDWAIRTGQSITFMNYYYLLSSWIIALLILTAIIPKTAAYKVLSNKVLVFLGVISYSLYLIHIQVIDWAAHIRGMFTSLITSQGLAELFYIVVAVILAITVSAFLFRVVEFLYFSSKKPVLLTTLAKEGEEVQDSKRFRILRHPFLKVAILCLSLFFFYTASYSPTQLISRHEVGSHHIFANEQTLLHSNIRIPFTSQYDNLSALSLSMRYTKNASITQANRKVPAKLVFKLFDNSGKQLFVSSRNAYLVEGTPRFGFGFPTINNSRGKQYVAELALVSGREDDQVFVDKSSTSFVSIYTTSKQMLLHEPWIFLLNRMEFGITNLGFIFALTFILLVSYFYRTGNIDKQK